MEYVNFECVHIMPADQNNPDERHAAAYADVDGYPLDENAEGTVICRVWLLKEKDGIYPRYLVDWHANSYRMNESVLELIEQAKKCLTDLQEQMVEEVFHAAYERYKLKWMLDHQCTLSELLEKLQEQMKDGAKSIEEAFGSFEIDSGFGGELWVWEDEFRDTEWENDSYMKELLTDKEYSIWHRR